MKRWGMAGECGIILEVWLLFLCAAPVFANNMRVTNTVVLEGAGGKAKVQFDIAWDNSWMFTNVNHDAAWVFFKVLVEGAEEQGWKHLTLSGAGTNPADYSTGSGGADFEIVVPDDRKGLFLRRSAANAGAGDIGLTNVVAVWDLAQSGMSAGIRVRMQTLAIEMCYVAEGPFWVGVPNGTETYRFCAGDDGASPFQITGEDALECGWGTAGKLWAWGYIEDGSTLSNEFPKGYAAFYCMKYEVTQGQYADFLNTLTANQASYRAYTGGGCRHTITWNAQSGYTASAPDWACNYLSWADGAAFGDWSGLRPMTELEFEKACRGPLEPVAGEFAWGGTLAVLQTGHDTTDGPDGSGRERATPVAPNPANCNYGGGVGGPVRVGIYATNGASRMSAGASYWGIMELSGNVRELAVTVGNAAGRAFTGLHGDGVLTVNGDANVTNWPGANAVGGGNRAGSFCDSLDEMRISQRQGASQVYVDRWHGFGWRGARAAP